MSRPKGARPSVSVGRSVEPIPATAQPSLQPSLDQEDRSEDDEFWDAGSVVSFYTVVESLLVNEDEDEDFANDDEQLTGFQWSDEGEVLPEDGISTDIKREIDRIKELLRDKRHLDAYTSLQALESVYGEAALRVQHEIDVDGLKEDVASILEALHALNDDKHWMVAKERPLRVLYRHFKGTTVHALKLCLRFPHPPGHIIAIANEWDLIPTWNKYVLEAVKLAEPGNHECFVYGAQWMIKPFRHLDAIVKARGFDLAETHRCLIILINDVDADALPDGHRPVPEESCTGSRNKVNILPKSCIVLKPLHVQVADEHKYGKQLTEAHLMVYLDPHIPFVPGFLVNFVLGILAPYIARQMNKVLNRAFADLKGEYNQRVAQRPELYERINRRVMDFAEELSLS